MILLGQERMGKIQSWQVSDELWKRVEPLVPVRERPQDRTYRRREGGGRKPMAARQIFAAIIYVLRTGCQWKALPREFGSASAVHKHFQNWHREGFFLALWRAGLAEYDEMEGIEWRWQSIDGTLLKAPLGGEATGNNPTDRGKKGAKTQPVGRRPWGPALDHRQRRERPRRQTADPHPG